MLLQRVLEFARRPAREQQVGLRYRTRRALAKVPFIPVQPWLSTSSGEKIQFWWSYIPKDFHENRNLTEYWGDDRGPIRFTWEFLRPGMVFFDVGAFHGIFSILASTRVSSQGCVVAFEPSARERRRFKLHTCMNGLGNIRLEPYALSSNTQKLTFFTVAASRGMMNSLRAPNVKVPVHQTEVEAVSLDDYLASRHIERIDLMKIDVEGGELEAFRGAGRLLESIRPILICEILDWVTQPWGYAARDIVDCLRGHDYELFDFQDDGSLTPHIRSMEYPDPKNYLAVPREKLSLISRWNRQEPMVNPAQEIAEYAFAGSADDRRGSHSPQRPNLPVEAL